MKIVFVNRFFYPDHSATSQMVSDLAFHLAKKGCHVEVVTSRLGYEDGSAAQMRLQEAIEGVRISRVWTSSFGRQVLAGRAFDYLTFYASASWRLFRLLDHGDIVVAKTDPPLISVCAATVATLRRARLFNWLQDLFPEVAVQLRIRGFGGLAGRILRSLRNWSLRRAEINVAIGSRMVEHLIGGGIPAQKIAAIDNWADGEAIRPVVPGRNALRATWGLSNRFVVGYSGNLGRVHEFETLFGAIERLNDDNRVAFLIIGGGAGLDRLFKVCEARGLANIRFEPYQPPQRLAASLSVPDVHVVVLRPELEGLVVPSKFYGVLAAGRPVLFIGHLDGEIARKVAQVEAGLVVRTGDVDGLVAAIQRLRSDRGYCNQLGRNARVASDRHYSRAQALARWEAVLGLR